MERLLQLTLSGSAMALLLMLLRRVLGKKLPSTVYYYAWLLVLLRFLLPLPGLVPTAAESGTQPPPERSRYETVYEDEEPAAPAEDEPSAAWQNAVAAKQPQTLPAQDEGEIALPAAPARTRAGFDWRSETLWLTVWALGAALCFGFYALSYLLFTAQLRRTLMRPDAFTRAVYAAMPGAKPALWRSAAVKTPLTYGVLFPKIVLPAAHYDERELRNVFRHELTHARRGDTLYKWFAAAALSLHWFNPLSWLVRREIDRACELSCDEAVLRSMDRDEKQSYGETLLCMAASGVLPAGVVATTFATEKEHLKERLEQIMTYKRSGARVLAAVLALLLLAGCGLAAGPKSGSGGELAVEPRADSVVRVSTVDEFLAAIAPNTTIELAAGEYDLSTASNYGKSSNSGCYSWVEAYDGYMLEIRGVDDLAITGEGAESVTIAAVPRYANVLQFVSCRNVTVAGLTAGHTQGAYCSGGVLFFDTCTDCTVRQCGLFGCGTVGVTATDSSGLTVEDTEIYECSYGAVVLMSCRNVSVTDCEVDRCGVKPGAGSATNLFQAASCDSVNIVGCLVHDNDAQSLLNASYSQSVRFLSNEVKDNRFMGAFALQQYSVTVDGCVFAGNDVYTWYMYSGNVFACSAEGAALVGDAFETMTYREIDPADIAAPSPALAEPTEVAPGTEIAAETVDEFLAAIGPDRVIVLTGTDYDLSTASSYGGPGGTYYWWQQNYDGPGLVIDGVKGLTIKAASSDPKETVISAVPRYANVLDFRNCTDVSLIGFTAGHTKEPGACSGGVLRFQDCNGIRVDACRLYGCGILGVDCYRCTGFGCHETEIYECSQGAVNMTYTDGISFVNCDVHDVPDPAFAFHMCGDKLWNGEPLIGSAYDLKDGALVESAQGAGGPLEEGDILQMNLRQLEESLLLPEQPLPVPWPEGGQELDFARTVQQLIADGDWEGLADRTFFPMILFTRQGNIRVDSREDFLALDLNAILNESFRQRVGSDSLEAMSANAFGNGIVQNAVTFCHMEEPGGKDEILVVALIVRD